MVCAKISAQIQAGIAPSCHIKDAVVDRVLRQGRIGGILIKQPLQPQHVKHRRLRRPNGGRAG